MKIEKLQGKEIKDEYKCEMAEAFSEKWERVKDSTNIVKKTNVYVQGSRSMHLLRGERRLRDRRACGKVVYAGIHLFLA